MENIMVCVTRQMTCQRLIDFGKQLMGDEGDSLHIIHVAKSDYNFLGNPEEAKALDFLYEKARDAGAELTVLKSDDILDTLSELVRQNAITKVVVGENPDKSVNNGFLMRMKLKLPPKTELCIVPA